MENNKTHTNLSRREARRYKKKIIRKILSSEGNVRVNPEFMTQEELDMHEEGRLELFDTYNYFVTGSLDFELNEQGMIYATKDYYSSYPLPVSSLQKNIIIPIIPIVPKETELDKMKQGEDYKKVLDVIKNIDKSVVAYENGDIEEIQPVGKSRVIDFKDNANAIKINYADTIITKTETMLYNFYPKLRNFPMYERHALSATIRTTFLEVIKCIHLASKVRSKRITYLQEADGYLETIKSALNLAHNQKYISMGQHFKMFDELLNVNDLLVSYIKESVHKKY